MNHSSDRSLAHAWRGPDQLWGAYRAIVDGSVDLIAAIDREYNYIYANKTFLLYRGLSEDQVIGRHADQVLADDLFNEVAKPLLDRALKGETIIFEMPATYPRLGYRYMHITYYPLKDDQDRIWAVAAAIRDITDRKEMEEQLTRQANVLDTVMQNTGAMLVYFDRDFNFVMANKAYMDSCGHTWDQLEGQNHFRFFPSEENESIFRQVRDLGQSITFYDKPFEYATQPWRGFTYWDWSLVPVKNDSGHVIGLVLSLIETTVRKKAEEALRASEERFRKYFQIGLVGMAIESPTGDWIEINDRICEIMGYTRDEFLTRSCLELTHPEDRDKDMEQLHQLQRGEIDEYSVEKRFIRKDGKTIDCMVAVSCYRNPEGELQEVYGLLADITAQKRSEETLARARDGLEAKVRERTRELRELARKLVNTQEHERALIGKELHDEVGQLLTYTTLLISKAARNPDSDTLDEARSTVREAIAKLRNLSSILSAGQLRNSGLLRAVQSLCQEFARRTDIAVDFDYEGDVDTVNEGVSLAAYRIAQETLTNVLRHAHATRVMVRLTHEPGILQIEIKDNGQGFDTATVRESTGVTGMRERVLALGGKFRVSSSPGQGTLVMAEMPLRTEC